MMVVSPFIGNGGLPLVSVVPILTFSLQWWFLQEHMLAAECDLVPSPRPPPAWGSTTLPSILWLLTSQVSSLSSCMSCLQWWFTKGRSIAPAAEPSFSPSRRPPPAWGSVSRVLYTSLTLASLSPASAASIHPIQSSVWHLPCPVSVILILLLLPLWLLLKLQPYFRSKWPHVYSSVWDLVRSHGPAKFLTYTLISPILFFGSGWWYVTWYLILQQSWRCIIDVLSCGVVVAGVYYCSFRLFHILWSSIPSSLLPVSSWQSSCTVQSPPVLTQASDPPLLPAPPSSHASPRPSRRRYVPSHSPFVGQHLATFLAWFLRQSLLCGLTTFWIAQTLSSKFTSVLAPAMALPVFFLLTSAPPPIPMHTLQCPGRTALRGWLFLPIVLLGLLAIWLQFVSSLPIPAWLSSSLQISMCLTATGSSAFVLRFWYAYLLQTILAPTRASLFTSITVDPYGGSWLVPPGRRLRRNCLPRVPQVHVHTPLAPTGRSLRHSVFFLLLGAATLCTQSVASALPSPSPAPVPSLQDAPHWPAPSFDHLFGPPSMLPYSISYDSDPTSVPTYNVDEDFDSTYDDLFPSITDASDQHAANLIQLTDDALSLTDAGYRFSAHFSVQDTVPVSNRLPRYWAREHRRLAAQHEKIMSLAHQARDVSWSDLVDRFLAPFAPNLAAHVIDATWMYSFTGKGVVNVDLSRRFYHTFPAYIFNVKIPHVPLIVDTGASLCLTPSKSDFVPGTYSECDMKTVKGLSGDNSVAGQGRIRWAIKDTSGETRVIEIPGIHVPTSGVRLLSPQVLRKTHGLGGTIGDDGVLLSNKAGDVKFLAELNEANLPLLQLVDVPRTSSVWSETFSDLQNPIASPSGSSAHLSILDPGNKNLLPGEKELLLWHHRLSHTNLQKVQSLCKERQWVHDPSDSDPTPPILPTKHPSTIKCVSKDIKCGACCMAKQTRRSTRSKRASSSDPAMKLKTGHLKPGDCISVDHYVSPLPARRRSGYGTSSPLIGGALYVDHSSGFVFHYPQSDLTTRTTLLGKQLLEDEASTVSVTIKKYHSDNGIFSSKGFKDHCRGLGQSYSFCGVGAHHQNAVAERCIGTISRMARANLIHLMIHWPERCNLNLWALAMDYAVWVYNRLPKESLGGLSPSEFWSSTRSDHVDLQRAHTFGCPVYVLDPRLQDGKSIPKWDSRSRQGMFVGFSPDHSSMVPLVLNLQTGHISPQFHVIFDDSFHTVPTALGSDDQIDDAFAQLFDNGKGTARDRFADPNEVSEGARSNAPATSPSAPPSRAPEGDMSIHTPSNAPEGVLPTNSPSGSPSVTPPSVPILALDSDPLDEDTLNPAIDLHDFDHPPEHLDHPPDDSPPPPRRSTRVKRKPVRLIAACTMLLPLGDEHYATWGQPALDAVNFHHQHTYHAKAKVTRGSLDAKTYLRSSHLPCQSAFLAGFSNSSLQLPWDGNEEDFHPSSFLYNADVARINSLISPDLSRLSDPHSPLVSHIEPHALAAKRGHDPDNPSYDEAMSGPNQSDYLKAAVLELKTLQDDLDCWELVPRTDKMNVLPSTWAFKCKRYPDGRIKKFKARFCARGDRQVEGVDYFETWSPVVQWQTVRLMLILSSMLDLKSAQADITAAFVHADLPKDEEVYVHQPRGFKVNKGDGFEYVLKLKKSLYGLKQAPRHFFNYLTKHLEKHGLRQSNCDPCLFIGSDIIVIVYVDDILLYAKNDSTIDSLIAKLKKDDIWIRKEGSTEGFLGVDISKRSSNGSFTLTQTGLTKRVIEALGLHADWTGAKETPADVVALPRDANGTPADPLVNYSSVVGMLLYLAGHTRPDIAFAVHQCARYTFQPTHRHVTALKRIGRYLKGTHDKGLIMRPSKSLHVDCYPDADFAGLYSKEDAQDPHCVRSRTGFVICVANCPVLWKSKLQSEIALSTMEAEYVALSTACKDLFPLLDLIQELASACGLQVIKDTNFHVKVHEDNVGALTLGKLEPRRMTPRSKHYAIKYHWFREQIGPRNVKLVKIDTKDQLGDIFTKGLTPIPFKHLRLKLMGW